MHTMVGKSTMKKMQLPSGFSWKLAFLVKSEQGLYNRNDSKNKMEKRNMVKHGLSAPGMQNHPQWFLPMSNKPVIAMNHSISTKSAPLPLSPGSKPPASKLKVHPLQKLTCPHWPTLTRPSTTPSKCHVHNDGHIHHTSLLWGLPLEQQISNHDCTERYSHDTIKPVWPITGSTSLICLHQSRQKTLEPAQWPSAIVPHHTSTHSQWEASGSMVPPMLQPMHMSWSTKQAGLEQVQSIDSNADKAVWHQSHHDNLPLAESGLVLPAANSPLDGPNCILQSPSLHAPTGELWLVCK